VSNEDTRSTAAVSGREVAPMIDRIDLAVIGGPDAGRTFGATGKRVVVGTADGADLVMTDPTVSRFHCELVLEHGRAIVRDLGAKNGTLVDGVAVLAAPLADGAVLTLGKSTLRFAREPGALRPVLSTRDRFGALVGRSVAMRGVFEILERAAASDATVLLRGETGTGKDLAAASIHQESPRREGPFVVVDLAAAPGALLASELFGHVRGAFTGADRDRIGAFERGHGGTVFLDEIGSLRLDLQAKLLRALQEREIERLGGVRAVSVDVRILAATNVNLKNAVRARTFREDLYYRLNVVPLHVPPLRERREDIGSLVQYFVRKIARECGRDVRGVSAGALEVLTRYDWPGNVRELENVLHRAVVLARSPVIQLQDVPLDVAMPETGSRVGEDTGPPLREALEQFERQYILRVLEGVGWNVSHAARRLGVHRNTVLTKLSAWGIQRPSSAEGRSLSH
jgi:transcriptional regulator with GAF, ATPase, and Fis domain